MFSRSLQSRKRAASSSVLKAGNFFFIFGYLLSVRPYVFCARTDHIDKSAINRGRLPCLPLAGVELPANKPPLVRRARACLAPNFSASGAESGTTQRSGVATCVKLAGSPSRLGSSP